MSKTKDCIKVRGMFRVQLGENGKVVGDSGWKKNTVTNNGLDNYIAGAVGKASGSKQYEFIQVGTQTNAINATQQALSGEVSHAALVRSSVSPSTIATGTFQATNSFASNAITAATTIGAIGMYNTSSGGTIGCGQTFNTSQWQTNQALSCTYQLRFS